MGTTDCYTLGQSREDVGCNECDNSWRLDLGDPRGHAVVRAPGIIWQTQGDERICPVLASELGPPRNSGRLRSCREGRPGAKAHGMTAPANSVALLSEQPVLLRTAILVAYVSNIRVFAQRESFSRLSPNSQSRKDRSSRPTI